MRVFSILLLALGTLPSTALAQGKQPDPNDAEGYKLHGICLMYEAKWDEAIAAFTESKKNEQPDVFLLRGFAYLNKAIPDRVSAVADFNEAIKREPALASTDATDAAGYRSRGIDLMCKTKWTDAIYQFTKSLEQNKNQSDVYALRGYSRSRLGGKGINDYVEIINDFEQVPLLSPRMAEVFFLCAAARNDKWNPLEIETYRKKLKDAKDAKSGKDIKLKAKEDNLKKALDAVIVATTVKENEDEKVKTAVDSEEKLKTLEKEAFIAYQKALANQINDKDGSLLKQAKNIWKEVQKELDDAMTKRKTAENKADAAKKVWDAKTDDQNKQEKDVAKVKSDSDTDGVEQKKVADDIDAAVQELKLATKWFQEVIRLNPARKEAVEAEIGKVSAKITRVTAP